MHSKQAYYRLFQLFVLLSISCSLVACFGRGTSPTPIPVVTVPGSPTALPSTSEDSPETQDGGEMDTDTTVNAPESDVENSDAPAVISTETSTPLPPSPTETATPAPTATPIPVETPTPPKAEFSLKSTTPLEPIESQPPTRLEIPQIGLSVPIVPMGWAVREVEGAQTTEWIVPDTAAGWHLNSANPGTAGNVILSGQQQRGDAVFAALAFGEVVPDQTLLLTDKAGRTFVYTVVEVTQPIPIAGATAEEEALASAYMRPSTAANLTLITGWPDFTTTHRLFVVAEFVGVLDE